MEEREALRQSEIETAKVQLRNINDFLINPNNFDFFCRVNNISPDGKDDLTTQAQQALQAELAKRITVKSTQLDKAKGDDFDLLIKEIKNAHELVAQLNNLKNQLSENQNIDDEMKPIVTSIYNESMLLAADLLLKPDVVHHQIEKNKEIKLNLRTLPNKKDNNAMKSLAKTVEYSTNLLQDPKDTKSIQNLSAEYKKQYRRYAWQEKWLRLKSSIALFLAFVCVVPNPLLAQQFAEEAVRLNSLAARTAKIDHVSQSVEQLVRKTDINMKNIILDEALRQSEIETAKVQLRNINDFLINPNNFDFFCRVNNISPDGKDDLTTRAQQALQTELTNRITVKLTQLDKAKGNDFDLLIKEIKNAHELVAQLNNLKKQLSENKNINDKMKPIAESIYEKSMLLAADLLLKPDVVHHQIERNKPVKLNLKTLPNKKDNNAMKSLSRAVEYSTNILLNPTDTKSIQALSAEYKKQYRRYEGQEKWLRLKSTFALFMALICVLPSPILAQQWAEESIRLSSSAARTAKTDNVTKSVEQLVEKTDIVMAKIILDEQIKRVENTCNKIDQQMYPQKKSIFGSKPKEYPKQAKYILETIGNISDAAKAIANDNNVKPTLEAVNLLSSIMKDCKYILDNLDNPDAKDLKTTIERINGSRESIAKNAKGDMEFVDMSSKWGKFVEVFEILTKQLSPPDQRQEL